MTRSVFTATGSYIPDVTITNQSFLTSQFYTKEGVAIPQNQGHVLEKFKEITGICERRYARPDQIASELGFLAANDALSSSGIDPETLDYIIVAHNFGDVTYGSNRVDMVPSLASRIKALLHINNPDTIAYDLAFGCPGWLEGLIQANYYIRSGDAKRCLVIGTETLSRVIDPHDRDSMLFSDGSGAVILEASDNSQTGILAHHTQTHACEYTTLLSMSKSYAPLLEDSPDIFMKMNGRKLYEFALNQVPLVIKKALDKADIHLSQISKVLIHQANEKMDVAILQRLYKLYNLDSPALSLMPMTISWLGNSSVATIPTLLDLIQKGKFENQHIEPGDKVVIASVGAGMNINAVIYQF
ncbi:ketoacyl-ACP synthase III [Spirosoma aureum]|uniref:Ketoacyl-ACP synthase III n=1 Tax=Spirosoma aureum TaxID=2692134 RepID=A0A6G9AM84_9BACT|nr:ketoacyl-ACP synthase III [Spirosoma aureum]QIP13520.1 ketoacyl-ACP synthase III [Spirosoma aureum]